MPPKRSTRQAGSSNIRLQQPLRSRQTGDNTRNYRTSTFTKATTIAPQHLDISVSSFKTKRPTKDTTKHLFCWFLKQISPGVFLVVLFLNYQNLKKAALVTAMSAWTPESALNAQLQLQQQQQPKRENRLGARVPKALRFLADLSTPYNRKTEVPFFWDIHFAGETLAESVFSKCHFLIQACEHGLKQPNFNDEKLEVFEMANGALYVNVDTYSNSGIQRAKELGLAEKKVADVTISPYIHLFVSNIFSSQYKGRMFALIRDPIERAISMYKYLPKASWDPMYNPNLNHMTLEEYAQSSSIENNWMTRFLLNKPGGRLKLNDMLDAKEILRTKCLVGLFEDIGPSLARFQAYFGWSGGTTTEQPSQCRSAVIEAGDARLQHTAIEKFGVAWRAIAAVNKFDLELYEYSKVLYKLQGEQIFGILA